MKFEATASFLADFKKLKPEYKAAFKKVVGDKFAPADNARVAYVWPKSLRVDELRGAAGVMEMTWSFASPDGRLLPVATDRRPQRFRIAVSSAQVPVHRTVAREPVRRGADGLDLTGRSTSLRLPTSPLTEPEALRAVRDVLHAHNATFE